MVRKIIAFALLIVAGLIALVLLMSGSALFPHLSGPVLFALVGGILLSPLGARKSH